MYNYYINEELVEEYPKAKPRKFKYGETHYVALVDGTEDETTRVDNEITDINEYHTYDYKVSRVAAYGTIESQLEFITENGLDAWQAKVTDIKNKYPKHVNDGIITDIL